MRLALAQLNTVVGDISGNVNRIRRVLEQVAPEKPDLVVFQELTLCGYPPKDLLERRGFMWSIGEAIRTLLDLSVEYRDMGILVGAPQPSHRVHGKGLFNTALLLLNGEILAQVNKSLLPTYDVFDEARYFDAAQEEEIRPIPFKGMLLGVSICEDAWNDPEMWYRPIYAFDPVARLGELGADIMINLSASPFNVGKDEIRFRLVRNHVLRHRVPFVLVNQVGGNDELLFDGNSLVLQEDGSVLVQMPAFEESVRVVEIDSRRRGKEFQKLDDIASVHDALVMGIRDYARKCGFSRAVLGLSGGIDSAVTCVLAARALGPENVLGVTMPSVYSSEGSVRDSQTLAENLGIRFRVIPIQPLFQRYLEELSPHFEGRPPDVTEENIQARIRGNIIMALSNKFGYLALSTGNKSELAMGYCTLYGDMTGGLAVISDVPKTMVYRLARYINREKEIIPEAILTKTPSAELRPNQTDQDSLPPYEILDGILELYLERGYTAREIIDQGFDRDTVLRVIRTVDRNEYKRRQAPPGLRITSKAFGSGRRMPIAAKFEDSWGTD
jgi:NAD+ synthase (glutamine-hydrolysing)